MTEVIEVLEQVWFLKVWLLSNVILAPVVVQLWKIKIKSERIKAQMPSWRVGWVANQVRRLGLDKASQIVSQIAIVIEGETNRRIKTETNIKDVNLSS